MELRELNGTNQPIAVNGNGNFPINQLEINPNGEANHSSVSGQQVTNENLISNRGPHGNLYRGHQPHQHQQPQTLRYAKHRELPVDVPDSFVGMAKQSPRYPPPKPHRQVSPSIPVNSNTNNMTTFNQIQHATTGGYTSLSKPTNQNQTAPDTKSNNHFNNNNSATNSNGTANISQSAMSQGTNINIVDHNSSLRSSLKLQKLENSRNSQNNNNVNYPVGQMQPAVNQAFEFDEGETNQAPQQQINQVNIPTNHHQNGQNRNDNGQPHQQKVKQPMTDLCSVYNRLQRNLNGDFANVSGDAKLAKLLSIYNTIVQTHNKQFKIPVLTSRHVTSSNQEAVSFKVSDLLQSVVYLLNDGPPINESAELLSILCKHEMEGVCSAFDRIVQSFEFAKSTSRSNSPTLSPHTQQQPHLATANSTQSHQQNVFHHQQQHNAYRPPHQQSHLSYQTSLDGQHQTLANNYGYSDDQVHMDIENNLYHNGNGLHSLTDLSDGTYTKTVEVEKSSKQALGATIVNGTNNSVVIGRVLCEGAAHESGLLQKGDEILEVNGIPMRGKNINEVVNLIERMSGTLTFTIVARNYNKQLQSGMQEKVYVRSFFKYDSEDDNFIPCKELGLSFDIGEVLIILDQSDKGWWQAKREGNIDCLPGLIPSLNLLKEREKLSNPHDNSHISEYMKHETNKKNLVTLLFNCPKGGTLPRRRKKILNLPFPEEIPYYEELAIYYPDQFRKRPIILVGPKLIGQREIVAKLSLDTSKFANPIAHTSRPMQAHERNGVDFHFVTRAQFEADIKAGKFIECGQYQNQYYGTSLDAIMEVVKSKKTCVHMVNTPSIFSFRQGRAGAELKPFFVFVKPDDSHPEKLRNIVASFSQPKSNIEENIRSIMAEVQMIEAHYLPFFDKVITVTDVDQAYRELLQEIDCIEKNPQWIPLFWKTKQSG